MAFRQTTFDPSVSAQYARGGPGVEGLAPVASGNQINMYSMEESLAREMAKMKVSGDRQHREIEKICKESDEIKELQARINAAYLNKERGSQITETQYRKQVEIENEANIDMVMLRNNEINQQRQREKDEEMLFQLEQNKKNIQAQIEMNAALREEARKEYEKERDQVDKVVQRMIDEDNEMARIVMQKREQSQADMILSMNEKRALLKRQKEMEQYEEEMVKRYAQQQQARQDELTALKAQAEEAREKIFQKLKEEEDKRRAEEEFKENLRNELYLEETEFEAQARERAEAEKRIRVREELQAAKDFQLKLKEERAAEEKRMEEEFKRKLMEKFAEDERLEQMNAQRRRMRELEHKREIERLWKEKLAVYKEQRAMELAEIEAKKQEEQRVAQIIAAQKEALLAQHAAVLQAHNPKALQQYK